MTIIKSNQYKTAHDHKESCVVVLDKLLDMFKNSFIDK